MDGETANAEANRTTSIAIDNKVENNITYMCIYVYVYVCVKARVASERRQETRISQVK